MSPEPTTAAGRTLARTLKEHWADFTQEILAIEEEAMLRQLEREQHDRSIEAAAGPPASAREFRDSVAPIRRFLQGHEPMTDTWRADLLDLLDEAQRQVEAGPPASAELLERLAAIEHEQWITWSKEVAPDIRDQKRVTRWSGYWKPYDQLDEATKEHDRVWARKVLAALPEAAVQEPVCLSCDGTGAGSLGQPCDTCTGSGLAAQPPPASVPTGYWEASGDLTPETARSVGPILERAARDGKQLVVHEGITLRWRAAQPAPDPEAIRLLRAIVDTTRSRLGATWHIPAGTAFTKALDEARSFLSKSEARESGGEP